MSQHAAGMAVALEDLEDLGMQMDFASWPFQAAISPEWQQDEPAAVQLHACQGDTPGLTGI